jgi:hypothetical protein
MGFGGFQGIDQDHSQDTIQEGVRDTSRNLIQAQLPFRYIFLLHHPRFDQDILQSMRMSITHRLSRRLLIKEKGGDKKGSGLLKESSEIQKEKK